MGCLTRHHGMSCGHVVAIVLLVSENRSCLYNHSPSSGETSHLPLNYGFGLEEVEKSLRVYLKRLF